MSNFLSALQNKATEIQTTRKVESSILVADDPIVNVDKDPLIVTVDRVLDRNRLDVFFNRKPSDEILGKLRGEGFRFRPSDKAWYHADMPRTRQFCETEFSAVFGAIEEKAPEAVAELPEYATFRRQVDELIAELKIGPADLMLVAIDSLHKARLGRN